MDGVTGLTGAGGTASRTALIVRVFDFGSAAPLRRGLFCFSLRLQRRLHQAAARAGSIEAPRRSFTSAMTRPMSFIEEAPVSATISRIFASASASLSCFGQEALDHRDLGFLDGGAVLAAVLAVDVGGFRGAA